MGFDPDKGQREHFIKDLAGSKVHGVDKGTSIEGKRQLSMYYFMYALHFEDEKLLSEMADFYKSVGWNEQLIKAKEMVSIAKSANLNEPHSMIEVYIKCLNILYKGKAKFMFIGWKRPFPNLPKIQSADLGIECIQQKKIKTIPLAKFGCTS